VSAPSPSIFVVEDDAMMRDALNSLLHAHGFEPRFAPTAELALLDAKCEASECLIVDIALPGMSGLEFVGQMARRAALLPQRVIFITASDAPELLAAAQRLGARALLRKPFPGGVLAELVRQIVARNAQARCSPPAELRAHP
jgi:FixJ family two-component response regulator